MFAFSFRSKKRGSTTSRAAISIAMLALFLLYTTSIGVNASNSGTSTAQKLSLNWDTTTKTVYRTTTIYRTHTTTKTTTEVSTSVSTSTTTSTVITTPTTTTFTIVQPTTTTTATTTVTAAPNVIGDSNEFYFSADQSPDLFQSTLSCSITVSLKTFNVVTDSPATVSVEWYNANAFALGQSTIASSTLGDADGYVLTVSATTLQLNINNMPATPPSQIEVIFSYTAICPPS